MIYLRGDGKTTRRAVLASLPSESWPRYVHDDDGRHAWLLTPGLAVWRRKLFCDAETALFARRDAFVAARADWKLKKEKVEASTRPASFLAPHRKWIDEEKARLETESASCRAAWEAHQALCAAFLEAVEDASLSFWSAEEMAGYLAGSIPPAPPGHPPPPPERIPFHREEKPLSPEQQIDEAVKHVLRHHAKGDPRAASAAARAWADECGGPDTTLGRHWLAVSERLSTDRSMP